MTARWLSPEAAADYIGVRVDKLPKLAKAGKLPPPSRHLGPRQPRYDRTMIDALFAPQAVDTLDEAVNAAVQSIRAENPRRHKDAR